MSELRIIDADGHAGEDVNAIAEDLEPPFGTRKFFFCYGRATADFAARVFLRRRLDYGKTTWTRSVFNARCSIQPSACRMA